MPTCWRTARWSIPGRRPYCAPTKPAFRPWPAPPPRNGNWRTCCRYDSPRHGGRKRTHDELRWPAMLQTDGMEVHQQTDGNLAHSEVAQNLRVVHRKQCDDGFDLNKDGIAHKNIRAKAEREGLAFVNDRDRDLPLERNTGLPEFV